MDKIDIENEIKLSKEYFYELKNDMITLGINSKGAEMKSLKNNETGLEYLWQADPAFWGRTSPILFPVVGNYKDKTTYYEGKAITLSQHGFARDTEFELVSGSIPHEGVLIREID